MPKNWQGEEQPGLRGQFLAALPVFEGLSPSELRELESNSSTHLLEPGEKLIDGEGFRDLVFIVLAGYLDLCIQANQNNVSLRLMPGDMIGEAALRMYLPRFTTVIAGQRSEIVVISGATLDSILSARIEARSRVSAEVSRHLLLMELAAHPMFCEVDPDLLSEIARNSKFIVVKRGEIVIREGDPSDGIYVVVWGALEVFRQQADGTIHSIDILRENASVGEMAALMNEPRSTSVRVWRDALLIQIPDSSMQQVFRTNAGVTFNLARTLGERLKRTTSATQHSVSTKTIAIIPWCRETDLSFFCRRLQRSIQNFGQQTVLLTAADFRREAGGIPRSVDVAHDRHAAWLAAKEAAYEYVLCQCDGEDASWTKPSVQQADVVIFVGMFTDVPARARETSDIEAARASGARTELVLLRESSLPTGTAEWLNVASFAAHHHIRLDQEEDWDRAARRITGHAWGLILGGGGARGLAHIGVVKALRENKVPIDMIGGTSMGAVIAALYAAGFDYSEVLAAARKTYVDRSRLDLTLPFVSVRSGRSSVRGLQLIFGERNIEDLPMSYFCVSCDLVRAESVVHDRGPVWLWTRVSCSVPGLLPPVAYQGKLLIDGGFLDNLPVSTMRTRCRGFVVASDVSVAVDLHMGQGLEMQPYWSGTAQLLRKFAKKARPPHIAHLLMRSAEISSVRDSKIAGSPADLYMHPPVDEISMTDFQSIDRIVQIGYEYASARLQDWKTRQTVRAVV
jgi:predicted acylesterase/phospholipase RssA/CRP-like cAMP-binding protein